MSGRRKARKQAQNPPLPAPRAADDPRSRLPGHGRPQNPAQQQPQPQGRASQR